MSIRSYIFVLSSFVVSTTMQAQVSDSTTTTSERIDEGTSTPTAEVDTLDWRDRHSPTKAAIFSAVIPGAGQIYNRKYWKAPIVWAGLGTCVYFIQDNNREYNRYKDAYLAVVDGDPNTTDEFNGQYSAQQLRNVVDTYQKWRDLSYIALGLVYMLNVMDASVDANFINFDVSPDLSMRVGPSLPLAAQGSVGLRMQLALQ